MNQRVESIQKDIREKIDKFLDLTERDKNHRYRSWDHCYLFFQRFSSEPNQHNGEPSDEGMNLACLNPAFYLASWGMYRGSSFLLWKDYKVYHNVIEELMDPEFADLWNAGYYDELLKLGDRIDRNHEKIQKVFKLKNKVEKSFNRMTYIKENQEEQAHCTNTLTTKTLLGTMSCVPASN